MNKFEKEHQQEFYVLELMRVNSQIVQPVGWVRLVMNSKNGLNPNPTHLIIKSEMSTWIQPIYNLASNPP